MKLQNVLSTKQFIKRENLQEIFDLADECRENNAQLNQCLQGKILASLFYEPSTRTRFSFESAMIRLGGSCISTENASQFSSAAKGETLEDSIKVISNYVDVIVLRHYKRGASLKASRVSDVPIINAGDGVGEHPTQALLDLYTIQKELGQMDNIRIALVGDLLNGRTIHSLLHLLSNCINIKVYLVSPVGLGLPKNYLNYLRKSQIDFIETDNLTKILKHIDVLYVTRIQKERFSSLDLYKKMKDCFIINKKMIRDLPKKAIIMHPLPRISEITQELDSDSRAVYFRQAQNGLFIRMALLKILLDN